MPRPISNLQHWLNTDKRLPAGQEQALKMPFAELSRYPATKEGGARIKDYFMSKSDKALDGKTMLEWVRSNAGGAGSNVSVPDTHWDTLVTGQGSGFFSGGARRGHEDLFYSMGTFTLTGNSSGFQGTVDKEGNASASGNIVFSARDRYDWHEGLGVDIPMSMDMINKYKPNNLRVASPPGGVANVSDTFFTELEEKGYGRDFDIEAVSEPIATTFTEKKPKK